ncbi:cytochrome c3 family protein [Pseudomonas mangiferae]|uniref:Cytochrome C n=1 Tax=Pseudomonas mangiferae TaxID=2593654 RepID=A0A553GWA8_9PSED|nr:cytochrome c3 family protein [Pseudomonas mangiferae]TRX73743.1 cytochrome C [Pseudomonas mangiferae]
MAQIFSRAADTWFRVAMLVIVGGLIGVFIVAMLLERSDYQTGRGWTVDQPVPFSHQHHAGALQIDCRYCHAGVERSARAGFPPTHTCMSCHSQLWTQAEMLAPVRRSLEEDRPLRWNRVIKLPDYVYFQHDVHVQSGVGCVSCHGQVDTMPLLHKAEPLSMSFCLECHRDPAPRLQPRETVADMAWHTDEDRRHLGERLMREYRVDPAGLTSCSVCHR